MSEPTFRDFAGAIMQGDLDAAANLLQILLGTDETQSRSSAEFFQKSISGDPAFMQKAMGMRQVVTEGTKAELTTLLGECFALDAAASAASSEVVWKRFRS